MDDDSDPDTYLEVVGFLQWDSSGWYDSLPLQSEG